MIGSAWCSALAVRGRWRASDTLLALLVKSEEEEDLFLRRFAEFFATDLEIDVRLAEIDIVQVLADLKRVGQESIVAPLHPASGPVALSKPVLPAPTEAAPRSPLGASGCFDAPGRCCGRYCVWPLAPRISHTNACFGVETQHAGYTTYASVR